MYIGVDADGSARVLHLPADLSLERRPRPAGLPDELLLDEVAVTLVREVTLPAIAVDIALALEPFGFGWNRPRHAQEDAYHRLQQRVTDEQGLPAARHPAGRPLWTLVTLHGNPAWNDHDYRELSDAHGTGH